MVEGEARGEVVGVARGERGGEARGELNEEVREEPVAAPRPIRRTTRSRWIAVGIATLALALIAATVPSVFPTFVGPIGERHPPFAMIGQARRAQGEHATPPETAGRRDEEVTVPSSHPERGLDALAGTLSLPDRPGPHPAVVILGGSGPNPRDPEMKGGLVVHHDAFRLYDALADLMVGLGIAVLRYDKRTCRACYPDFEPDLGAFRFTHFEDDARDALAYLRSREDVRADALVLVGHSQGGGAAVRLAKEEPGIAGAVMLAGSTRAFADGLPDQLRRFAAIREHQWDWIGALTLRGQADDFEGCLAEASHAPDTPQKCLHGVTFRAFEDEAERAATTLPAATELPCPLLALHGQYDRNIDPAVILALRDALGDRNAEVHVVAGAGHTFVNERDTNEPRLDPYTAQLLRRFLAGVVLQ